MRRAPVEITKAAAKEDTRREYTPRGMGEAEGWIRVGRYDDARRRALWVRFVGLDDSGLRTKCKAIELCSGREGDDAFVRYTPRMPGFRDLLDVMLRAADHIPARWAKFDAAQRQSSTGKR